MHYPMLDSEEGQAYLPVISLLLGISLTGTLR